MSGAIFPSGKRLGTFTINYDCTSSKGIPAITATKTVIVRDTTCPTCTMKPGPKRIETSFPYLDAGAVCSDSVDGKIEDVVVTNPVNVEREGTYFVTYRAKDVAGNWNDGACKGSSAYIRTIQVVDTLKPIVALHYHGKIVSQSSASDLGANGEKNPAAMYGSFMEIASSSNKAMLFLIAASASVGVAILLMSAFSSRKEDPGISQLV